MCACTRAHCRGHTHSQGHTRTLGGTRTLGDTHTHTHSRGHVRSWGNAHMHTHTRTHTLSGTHTHSRGHVHSRGHAHMRAESLLGRTNPRLAQLGALCPAPILPPLWSSYKQVTGGCAAQAPASLLGGARLPPRGGGVSHGPSTAALAQGELCVSVCRITNCLHDLAHREISRPRWWVYKHCLLVVLGAFAGNRPHRAPRGTRTPGWARSRWPWHASWP